MGLTELRPWLRRLTADGSGKMDFEDFAMVVVKFILESDEDMTEQLREAFRLYDKGNQGYIVVDDLKEILRAVDDKMSDTDLNGLIKEIDQDGSGTVDFDEFLEMMNG
ncbi:PREDICTED: troponin C, isoform 2-like [Priapulus caudatus]|uniref:Troponin C, isoform 2-like n=1 Tax=Priapulus caudatus TaxID=37621 RepID=A0ABM1EV91_PRICU|nr:PREDICTED: troponin C, isoform 2-like [Priapulus caudatus]